MFLSSWTSPLILVGISAQDDFTEVLEDVSVRIMVLRNDEVPLNLTIDTASLVVHRPANNGFVTISHVDGTAVYTPRLNFNGVDSFDYQVCSTLGHCSIARVTVQVHPVNDVPVALDDHDTLIEDQSLWIQVLENDGDLADQEVIPQSGIKIVRGPRFGHASIRGQMLLYQPKADYFGNDVIYYSLCDLSLCDTAKVHLTILPSNDPPEANDDYDTTYQGLLLVMDVLSNDFDTLDFKELDFTSITTEGLRQPEHAFTFVDTSVGLLLYIPTEDFVGSDTFQYQVCDYDPELVLCDTAEVFITVTDLPMSANIISSLTPQISYKNLQRTRMTSVHEIFTNNSRDSLTTMLSQYLRQNFISTGKYRFSLSDDGKFQMKYEDQIDPKRRHFNHLKLE